MLIGALAMIAGGYYKINELAAIGVILFLLSIIWHLLSRPKKHLVATTKRKRRRIPKHVQHEVWQRDQACCVECGSKENLEFDHIIPLSKGGSDTVRNLQLLCEKCNRKKHAKI
ncbi:MAG: hypothetical protein A2Y62_09585 [Candidatus Fischerbacteria bacterium RBG_13_37_8]|uniref:HNH nuclease domain-containing protein n=1 Tax=Candidatus Fischerbacteria bacterium RBG_13_37_8 TaxID=1817863 RepID=A0A1F5V5R0_9BACT|nr:MAG: hypothetical protein A2Y62_09585 [Candidatus Fischerbacteria bacterium RBG_13_37_8]